MNSSSANSIRAAKVSATRSLGRSGLRVTAMGLGAAPLAHRSAIVPDADAHAAIASAYDAGVRLFDVAPFYGYGIGEHRVGHVLRNRKREDYVLSSKVGRLLKPCPREKVDRSIWADTLDFQPEFDYSFDGTLRSVEDSLQRLGVDRVDILHIHDVDHGSHGSMKVAEEMFRQSVSGAYPALERLRGEGVIKAIGVGNNFASWSLRFLKECDIDCLMLAGRYTLLEQDVLDDLLPTCAARGVGLMLGGVFNSGILAVGAVEGAWHHYAPAAPDVLDRVRRITSVCERHRVSLSTAAMRFPLGHASVASVVLGVVSPDEVAANVAAFERPLPADLWAELKHEGLIREDAPVPAE